MNLSQEQRYLFWTVWLYCLIAFIAILLMTYVVKGEEKTTYRDKSGRMIGSASTSKDGKTTFRDSSGRLAGTATKSGNTTTYRDKSGRVIAKETGSKSTPSPIPLTRKKR